jgi:hypothetical protein
LRAKLLRLIRHYSSMAKRKQSRSSLEQIRASLKEVVEPKLGDINAKLDHLIGTVREALARGSYDEWRRYE